MEIKQEIADQEEGFWVAGRLSVYFAFLSSYSSKLRNLVEWLLGCDCVKVIVNASRCPLRLGLL